MDAADRHNGQIDASLCCPSLRCSLILSDREVAGSTSARRAAANISGRTAENRTKTQTPAKYGQNVGIYIRARLRIRAQRVNLGEAVGGDRCPLAPTQK